MSSAPSRILSLLALWVGLALPAQGQIASLVGDLNPGPPPSPPSFFTDPGPLVPLGGKLVFPATEASSGRELWASDGTAAGTEILDDLCPGSCGSDPEIVGTAGGLVFFVASLNESDTLTLLWRTDGTRAGTFPLDSPGLPTFLLRPGDGGIYTVAGRSLYFLAGDLWRTDGTSAGTVRLAPFDGPFLLTSAGGKAYFFSRLPSGSLGLYTSDVTTGATLLVKDLGLPTAFPSVLAAAGNRVFFTGGFPRQQLWVSDGSASGTFPVSQFESPGPFHENGLFAPIGNRLYFLADDVTHGSELWVSDGTPAGTRRVTDFGYDRPFDQGLSPRQIALLGDRLVFVASDGLTPPRLWTVAGTPESTAPLSTVQVRGDLVRLGGRVVFQGVDAAHGAELWSSDGTAAGTVLLKDTCQGSCSGMQAGPLAAGSAVYFLAADPVHKSQLWTSDGTRSGTRSLVAFGRADLPFPFHFTVAALGRQVFFFSTTAAPALWRSDGTAAGTQPVFGFDLALAGSLPQNLTDLAGRLVFTADDGHGRLLWRSDGTAAGTLPFPETRQRYQIHSLRSTGGGVFFVAIVGTSSQLFRTDGTSIVQLTHASPAALDQDTELVETASGRVLFAENGTAGSSPSLWTSDGTVAGTVQLFDLPGRPLYLTDLGDGEVYFFTAFSGQNGIWKADLGGGGVVQLVSSSDGGVVPHFTRLPSGVVFFGPSPGRLRDAAVWRTDGTPAGTVAGESFYLDLLDDHPGGDVIAWNGALYFFAEGPGGLGLWRSDGAQSSRVAEIPGQVSVDPAPPEPRIVAFGSRLYFMASDDAHGRELWASDGTPQGTSLLRDLAPGRRSASPHGFLAVQDRLFFSADDGLHGFELWESDGTAVGTRLVQDIAPGAASAAPESLTVSGDRLYFAADDRLTGSELWSLPLSGPSGCSPGETRLCLAGNRFQVEVAWKDFQGHTGVGHAVPLTADTGYYWFFADSNVELVVKVLDARSLNQAFWVFYGALSTVEYRITVTDTQTGLTRRYVNPSGNLASVGDTHGFGPLGAFDTKAAVAPASPPPLVSASTDARAATGSCVPGAQRLCMNGGRFAVTAAWKDFSGHTGPGTAVALTGDTGYFWFFSPTNVEVVTKVLDGRGLNGKFWLFYGALSNVEYTLTVTDTQTGAVKTYKNPLGQFGSVGDTGAF